jgi:cytochrome c
MSPTEAQRRAPPRRPGKLVQGAAAALFALAAPAFAGDAERGRDVFEECAACHMVGAEARHRVGPHLNGLFGRRAAAFDDYVYSEDMRRAGAQGLTWTAETLHVYIENPQNLVTHTRMSYPGMEDRRDREDLFAYLRQFSANPRDIPEAPPTAAAHALMAPEELLALEGDPDYGEYLASECVSCHQAKGTDEGIPAIVGWPEDDFKAALHGYRIGARPNPAMQLVARALTDEDIAALAAWFASGGR